MSVLGANIVCLLFEGKVVGLGLLFIIMTYSIIC